MIQYIIGKVMEDIKMTENNIEFTSVDIEEFYDKDELNKDEFRSAHRGCDER